MQTNAARPETTRYRCGGKWSSNQAEYGCGAASHSDKWNYTRTIRVARMSTNSVTAEINLKHSRRNLNYMIFGVWKQSPEIHGLWRTTWNKLWIWKAGPNLLGWRLNTAWRALVDPRPSSSLTKVSWRSVISRSVNDICSSSETRWESGGLQFSINVLYTIFYHLAPIINY